MNLDLVWSLSKTLSVTPVKLPLNGLFTMDVGLKNIQMAKHFVTNIDASLYCIHLCSRILYQLLVFTLKLLRTVCALFYNNHLPLQAITITCTNLYLTNNMIMWVQSNSDKHLSEHKLHNLVFHHSNYLQHIQGNS